MNSNFKREFMNGKKDISRSAFGAFLALVLAPCSAVTQQPILLINNSSSQFTTCAGTQIPAIASADYTINDNSLITYTSTLLQNNQALATGSETFNCSQTPCYEYYAYGDALTVQNGLSTYQVQLTVTDQSNNILYAGDSNLVDVTGTPEGAVPKINGSSADNVSVCATGPIIMDGSASCGNGDYFLSVQLSDRFWGRDGTEEDEWLTPSDYSNYGPINNFNVMGWSQHHWIGFVGGQYYRVKLATGPGWNEHTQLVAIEQPPPPNMVAWYPFDQAGSQPDLIHKNTATAFGTPPPTSIPGEVAGGLSFNGTNDYLQAPDQTWLNMGLGSFSIMTWMKISTAPTHYTSLVDKRQQTPPQGYQFFLYPSGSGPSQLGLQMADNSGYSNYASTAAVPADGNWHLVAVTVTRNSTTGGTFYLDGKPIGTFNPTGHQGSLNSTGSPLLIGQQESYAWQWTGPESFNGGLDELQIFSRALTSAEVLRVFQTGAPGECKP